jgi:sugar phosphate isomerase/epimerase
MRARGRPAAARDVLSWISLMGGADGISDVFLNHPEHTEAGVELAALRSAILAVGLRPAAVCTRFPASLFRAGALSAANESTRVAAVELVAEACAAAATLGASEVVVWPQFDGYDYHLSVNYTAALAAMALSLRQARAACPAAIGLSLEWKPTDGAARFSFVPNTASALLLVQQAGPGVGVTLDAGHALAAGENPAQSAALLLGAGRLSGVQLGDAHNRLGAEDGLVFGSVHGAAALELVHTLRVGGYRGCVFLVPAS